MITTNPCAKYIPVKDQWQPFVVVLKHGKRIREEHGHTFHKNYAEAMAEASTIASTIKE